jgi:hypothetical protein
MATAKQLAALKKGREARAKKIASKPVKTVKKKTVRKVTARKKNPIGVSQNFAVKVIVSGQAAYLSSLKPIRFDTLKSKARVFTKQAEAIAWRSTLDRTYGSHFSVVRLPKS